jgi:hypothetical protein
MVERDRRREKHGRDFTSVRAKAVAMGGLFGLFAWKVLEERGIILDFLREEFGAAPGAMELRRHVRSQMEFGNEGKGDFSKGSVPRWINLPSF